MDEAEKLDSWHTGYPDLDYSSFSSVPPGKYRDITLISP
jgi:hypothetical protein